MEEKGRGGDLEGVPALLLPRVEWYFGRWLILGVDPTARVWGIAVHPDEAFCRKQEGGRSAEGIHRVGFLSYWRAVRASC